MIPHGNLICVSLIISKNFWQKDQGSLEALGMHQNASCVLSTERGDDEETLLAWVHAFSPCVVSWVTQHLWKGHPVQPESGKVLHVLVCCRTWTPGSPGLHSEPPSNPVNLASHPCHLRCDKKISSYLTGSTHQAASSGLHQRPLKSGLIVRLDTNAKTKAYNFICKCGHLSGIWWCHFTLWSLENMW